MRVYSASTHTTKCIIAADADADTDDDAVFYG